MQVYVNDGISNEGEIKFIIIKMHASCRKMKKKVASCLYDNVSATMLAVAIMEQLSFKNREKKKKGDTQ